MRSISFPFVLALIVLAACSRAGGDRPSDAGAGGAASPKGGTLGGGGATASGGASTSEPLGSGGSGGANKDGALADAAGSSPDGMLADGGSHGGAVGAGGMSGSGGSTATTTPTGGATAKGGSGGTGGAGTGGARAACSPPSSYRNLFVEILGKTQEQVDAKLDGMVKQLFHGSDDQKIYYELGSDQAQIYDIASEDVRSEGQSYGMMVAVQMGMREEFDKLWRYAANCMRQPNGTFTWSMEQGSCKAKQQGFAPDGEEYFAMALLLASRRWDTSTGADYGAEAKNVLKALATQLMFSKSPACVYYTMNSGNSDPSYVLPLFYAEWACIDPDNAQLWTDAVTHARSTFFRNACNKQTGLAPERSSLDGVPQDEFGPDSWRVPMNIMMDYNLNNADAEWQMAYAKTHAAFWVKEGLTTYGDRYSLSGEKKNSGHGPGQDGANAMLAFALPSGDPNAKALLQRAWDVPVQSGRYRYYNGCLQLLSFLHTSGRFNLFYP